MLSFVVVIANVIVVCFSHPSHEKNSELRKKTDKTRTCFRSSERIHPRTDSDGTVRMTASSVERKVEESSFEGDLPNGNKLEGMMESMDFERQMERMDFDRKIVSSNVERERESSNQSQFGGTEIKHGVPQKLQTSERVVFLAPAWLDKVCFLAFFAVSLVANVVTMSILFA